MTIIQAAVLGVVQGATEFLPISSSGHLIFIPKLFGWPDQGISFDLIVHLGTLLAVMYYYRAELIRYVRAALRPSPETRDDRRMAWLLVISTIPAAIVALIAGNAIEGAFRTPVAIGVDFIVWGIVLWLADRFARRNAHRTTGELTLRDAVTIGAAQVLALMPGTSRSGITMTAGLFSGFRKASAAEVSFLMSVPIIALAGADGVRNIILHGANGVGFSALAVGFTTSALAGFVAIGALMRIIKRWSFTPFVVYRIIMGVLIIALLA